MILAVRRPAGRADEADRRAARRSQIAEIKAYYGLHSQSLETLLLADPAREPPTWNQAAP